MILGIAYRFSRKISVVSGCQLIPIALFGFTLSVTLLGTGYGFPGGDARYYTALTRSITWHGELHCTNSGIPMSRSNMYKGPDGEIYTKYPPGQPLIQVPLYYLFDKLISLQKSTPQARFAETLSLRLTQALLTAFAVMLLYLLLQRRFNLSVRTAMLTSIIYLLCTQAYIYSKLNYSEALQAAIVLLCVYLLLKPTRHLSLMGFSAAFSFLVLTKPALILIFPAFLFLIIKQKVYKSGSATSWSLSAMIILASAAFLSHYNYIRNGSIIEFGYASDEFQGIEDTSRFFETLKALIVSPDKSIVLYNPVLILMVPGLFLLKNSTYKLFLGGLMTISIALFSAHGYHWSGHYGQRYLVPFIGLMMPFIAMTLERLAILNRFYRSVGALFIIILCVASSYITALGTVYFHFAGKNFCHLYDKYAQKYDLPHCNEQYASNDIALYGYLLIHDDFPKRREFEEFPWIEKSFSPTIATRVLTSKRLNRRWVRRDLMFFEPKILRATRAAELVKIALMFLFGLSVVGLLLAHDKIQIHRQREPTHTVSSH